MPSGDFGRPERMWKQWGLAMRSIAGAVLAAAALATGGCNTVHGVGKDVSSLKEVVPRGSSHARADSAAPPAAEPAPNGTE